MRGKRLFPFVLPLFFAVSESFSEERFVAEVAFYAPDAGMSDEFIVQLGTGAQQFLIDRLRSVSHERFHAGIAYRLSQLGGQTEQNSAIANVLFEHAVRLIGEGRARRDIDYALVRVAMRGGGPAVLMLQRLATNNARAPKARLLPHVPDSIVSSAIHALAFSPHPSALPVLRGLLRNPPKPDMPGLSWSIGDSISANEIIQKIGLDAYLSKPPKGHGPNP